MNVVSIVSIVTNIFIVGLFIFIYLSIYKDANKFIEEHGSYIYKSSIVDLYKEKYNLDEIWVVVENGHMVDAYASYELAYDGYMDYCIKADKPFDINNVTWFRIPLNLVKHE